MTRRNGNGREPARRGNARPFRELPGARRRVRWRRLGGFVTLVLGLSVLLVSVVVFSTVPGAVEEARAFRAAAECDGPAEGEPREAREGRDCLRSVNATVRSVTINKKSNPRDYRLFLSGPDGVPEELSLLGDGPVLKRLGSGDRIGVTMWRDRAVAITHGGLTQDGIDDPEGMPEISTGVGLVLLTAGGCLLYLGGHLVVRARDVAEHGPPPFYKDLSLGGVGTSLGAIPAVLAGNAAAGSAGDPVAGPVVTAVVWLVLALVVTVLMRLLRGFLHP
ncbi:hypothetical protein C0036_07070 [Streptomyces sp. DJ]|uniref:hypothetical protein n=1 Tax=Streptomyces sp. SCUT-3 TaxID=2684469 RepID=UPI000CC34F6F|nr:hypothetical protein [Streptomyces sp. SCUT-3]PLW73470.1 hypothetical protein C0036_07070 [Streptomyces sp. DJ]